MHKASVHIGLKLDYKEIPVPKKIVIQLEPGEIRLFGRIKYAQHQADPLSAIKLSLKHEGENQLQIVMQLAGGIVLTPGGEFKFGGTKLVLVCTPVIAHNKLMLQKAMIKEIQFPMLPPFFKTLFCRLVNKSFIPNLNKSLNFDLEHILDEVRKKMNQLQPVNLDVGKQKLLFRIMPNIEDGVHKLTLSRDAVHLELNLSFAPAFALDTP